MEIQSVSALRGPNVWASFPVLEAWVHLGELKDTASTEIPGFNERLTAWLPSLVEHRCSEGVRGGLFRRLERGTYLAHILEHVTLELQSLAGTPVGFGRTRQACADGVYRVAIEYAEEDLARACLESARELCLAAVADRPFDVDAEIARLRELAQRTAMPAGEKALLDAAFAHGIPVQRLGDGLLQFGYGARQHRILNGLTDDTGALPEYVAWDNELTRGMLRSVGIPVTPCRGVSSAEDAWAAAQELGLPVLVRPRYGSTDQKPCSTREEVAAAHAVVAEKTSYILVERAPAAPNWRLLVVGKDVIALDRLAASLGERKRCTPIDAALAARAVEAVQVIGLSIAAVEVCAPSLDRPLEETGGVIAHLDPRPMLTADAWPVLVTSKSVADAVLEQLFPGSDRGRIPIVGVTGVNGKTTTTRFIAHLLSQTHRSVGMSCTEGIHVGGERTVSGDCSGPKSARSVLQNARVDAAVLETARGGILREGLGFDCCDVAVVTNIGEGDHLGIADVNTPEQLAWVKSTVVAAVAPTGAAVLNAKDPLVVDMARWCKGAVVYFGRHENYPVIAEHRNAGGRAVFARGHHVVLAEGKRETMLTTLDKVPLTHAGRIGFQVENTLAAVAAAWSLGVPLEKIRDGLVSFAGGMDQAPGRFNLIEINDAKVLLDYGHNVSALESLIEALDAIEHRRRTIIYSSSGDRRDCDFIRQGELLGEGFDRVVLYEDPSYLRGRSLGDMTALFSRGLSKGKRVQEVNDVGNWHQAVELALASLRSGDLLVIQPDLIDETVSVMRQHLLSIQEAGVRDQGSGVKGQESVVSEQDPDFDLELAAGDADR